MRTLTKNEELRILSLMKENPIKATLDRFEVLEDIFPVNVLRYVFGGLVVYTPKYWDNLLEFIIDYYNKDLKEMGIPRVIQKEELNVYARRVRRNNLKGMVTESRF